MKRRVAILISGRGSNMAALIQAAAAEDFPAHIVVVVSNRADAGGLETAKASGVPTVTIESKPFGKDRAAFEAGFESGVGGHPGGFIWLGGFLRVVPGGFFLRRDRRVLHNTPSL